jgi:hypothetical protein
MNKAYVFGMMTKVPVRHKIQADKQKPDIGHTVVADVYGPIPHAGLNGERYYAFFVDKGGGMNGVYPMKSKDEAFDKFKKFYAFKNSLNNNIKQFESGEDKELMNKVFKTWLRDRNIFINTGAPYKHEHTSSINLSIRYTMNLARSMIAYAKDKPLGNKKFLYPYAVTYANYIRNRTRLVKRGNVKQTRFEWSTGQKPDISKLCYWGCLGYRRVPIRKDKQDEKANVGYFLGFDNDGKSTYVYVPESKKIIKTADFIFDELATNTNNEELTRIRNLSENDIIDDENDDESVNNEKMNVEDDESEVDHHNNSHSINSKVNETENVLRTSKRNKKVVDYKLNKTYHLKPISEFTSLCENYLDSTENVQETHDFVNNVDDTHESELENILKNSFDFVYNTVTMQETNKELLEGSDGAHWKQANDSEFESLKQKNVFEIVPRSSINSDRVHKYKMINVVKTNHDDTKRYKSRCVLAGWSMRKDIDYHETFSPTVKQESFKTCIVVAVQKNLEVHHIDYKTAYLNADMDTDVYMEIPEGYDYREDAIRAGFNPDNDDLVVKVKKSIYGTPQAGRLWHKALNDHILTEGFKPYSKDPCIYFKRNPDGNIMIICLYVDDMLICAKNDKYLKRLKENLNKKYEMNDLGRVTKFLGLRFKQYNNRIEIDLEQYIDKMLKRFNMEDCNASDVPALADISLSKQHGPSSEGERIQMTKVPYRELVGSLIFASISIIPQISADVSKLSEFMNNPGLVHWREAKRVLSYLKGIKSQKFIYFRDDSDDKFTLHGYVDADWAANHDNRRSRAGYVFKLGRCLISWASMMEPVVALSSAESELMAATLAAKQCVYIRDILEFLGYKQNKPTIIFEDNSACIRLSKNPEFHKRTKHIDIRYFFIREKYISNEIVLVKVDTKHNIADLFTKPLRHHQFSSLINKLFEYEEDS